MCARRKWDLSGMARRRVSTCAHTTCSRPPLPRPLYPYTAIVRLLRYYWVLCRVARQAELNHPQIAILDFGSQYSHLICRRLRGSAGVAVVGSLPTAHTIVARVYCVSLHCDSNLTWL